MQPVLLALLMTGATLVLPNNCVPDSDARAALMAWRYNSNSGKIGMPEQRKALDALAEKYPADLDIQAARIKFYSRLCAGFMARCARFILDTRRTELP